jgi:hypothetical protein
MAFKKKYTAFCDHCHREMEVWAKNESDANRILRNYGWDAMYGVELIHKCDSCKKHA